jgi:hypothetical protein
MLKNVLRQITRWLVPPYRAKRPPSREVAIVVFLSNRPELTAEEKVSVRHLRHFLGCHDKYLVAPMGLAFEMEGLQVKRFSKKFFGSAAAHNRLLFWPGFYKAFADYKYILVYHLDSLVFSDQLLDWCKTDVDFIGAPWLPCPDTPQVKKAAVGNGGFTLMKTASVLTVLYNRYRMEPSRYWQDLMTRNAYFLRPLIQFSKKFKRQLLRFEMVDRFREEWVQMENPGLYGRASDLFWAEQATKYLPTFKIASVEDGLRFAFETSPRTCYELNHRQMPFGCHAWARYDRSFWEPFLLKEPVAD